MTPSWRARTSAVLAVLLAAVTVVASQPAAQAATTGTGFAPTTPARLLDTRTGVGAPTGKVLAGRTVAVQVTGRGGIPASGVAAVSLNVTVTGTERDGFVTVYPDGTRPTASTVNFTAGQTLANQAVVKVSSTGKVTVYAHSTTHVVVDVLGWFPTGSDLRPLSPVRTMDTRTGLGAPLAPVAGGTSVALQVTGRTGVPSSGVGAVLLNVTVTNPRAAGFVTAYPTGTTVPQASNVNHNGGQTISGFVVAKVGTGGKVSLATKATTDLVVDVSGWFPTGSAYTPLTPGRLLDTRTGIGAPVAKVSAGGTVTIQVGGVKGVAADADAAFVNVTAVNAGKAGFATVYPAGTERPGTSTVNYADGRPISNSSFARLGADGRLTIHSTQTTDLIVDVFGWVPDTNPAGPVTGLDLLDRADTTVQLGWANPADPDLGEVVVRRAEGATPPASVTAGTSVPLSGPTATSVTDTGLTSGAVYSYSVFTVDDSGNLRTTPSTVVANPVTGQLSVGDVGLQATWSADFGPTAAGRTVTFQVRSIVTSTTDEVTQASWRPIGTAVADASGVAALLEANPLEVTHSYRAVTGTGSGYRLSDLVTHAAKRTTKSTGLATVYLDTNEADPILSRSTYLEGRLTIVPGDATSPCATTTLNQALLKTRGRGNSTWAWPKKPYNVNLDAKADLCGLGSSKKWALLANHFDKSLLRTGVAMDLGHGLSNLAWTPKQVPVDFYLNGVFQGSYSLIERVGIATNRVNITQLKDNQTGLNDVAPQVTGGYLLEWDFRAGSDHNVQVGPDGVRGWVGIKEPEDETDGSGITATQVAWIDKHLDTVDDVIFGPGFADPVTGWRKYIDEASAVDYYIAQEVTKPVDGAFGASVYMYKARDADPAEGDQGKLFMGPMWDYDIGMGDFQTLGDKGLTDTWMLRDPLGPGTGQGDVNWYNRLMQDPTFVAAVEARWAVVEPTLLGTVNGYLPAQRDLVARSAAANFGIWDINDQTWDGQVVKGSWNAEVTYLQQWLQQRIAWMDGELTP
jgi:hypothetical protein